MKVAVFITYDEGEPGDDGRRWCAEEFEWPGEDVYLMFGTVVSSIQTAVLDNGGVVGTLYAITLSPEEFIKHLENLK